jgi:hypothetical protein
MSEARPPKIDKTKRFVLWLFPLLAMGFLALVFGKVFLFPLLSAPGPGHAHATFKKAQASLDPEVLRKWASEQAALHPSGGDLAKQEMLKSILELENHPPHISITAVSTNENQPYIGIIWGGGFFHWGIFVGPRDYQLPHDTQAFHDIQWVPGIYFRHEGTR